MKNHLTSLLAWLIPLFLAACSEQVSFSGEVMPILAGNCSECHTGDGEGVAKSGFSVADYDHVMKGTNLGPMVVAGHSEISSLFQLISHQADPQIQMPPHHPEALPEGRALALEFEQIETIKDWIDQGAKNN